MTVARSSTSPPPRAEQKALREGIGAGGAVTRVIRDTRSCHLPRGRAVPLAIRPPHTDHGSCGRSSVDRDGRATNGGGMHARGVASPSLKNKIPSPSATAPQVWYDTPKPTIERTRRAAVRRMVALRRTAGGRVLRAAGCRRRR